MAEAPSDPDPETPHAFVPKPVSAPRGQFEPPGESCAICGRDPRNLLHRGFPAHPAPRGRHARPSSEDITLIAPSLASELDAFRATPLTELEQRVMAYIVNCGEQGIAPNVREIDLPREEVDQALVSLRLRGLIQPDSRS